MDASYTWHPGASGLTSQWARPVPLHPDELLSSWLVRAALAQGCDPLVLTGCVWPKWRAWTVDVDRTVTLERLTVLAELSGISVGAFKATALQLVSSQICGSTQSRMKRWPWILSLGARNTKRHGGLQYCPECLAADHDPYYRICWRFAWHTGCELHNRSLLDRCWSCSAPLEPHRLQATDSDITVCASCRKSLRSAPGGAWPDDARRFQIAADKVLSQDTGIGFGHVLNAPEWFDLASYAISLVRQSLRLDSGGLRSMVESVTSVPLAELLLPEVGGIEQIRTFERQAVLGAVVRFMETSAEDFQSACSSYGLSRQTICGGRKALPPVVLELSTLLKDSPRENRRKVARRKTTGPRPKYLVELMMARLERKARLLSK